MVSVAGESRRASETQHNDGRRIWSLILLHPSPCSRDHDDGVHYFLSLAIFILQESGLRDYAVSETACKWDPKRLLFHSYECAREGAGRQA